MRRRVNFRECHRRPVGFSDEESVVIIWKLPPHLLEYVIHNVNVQEDIHGASDSHDLSVTDKLHHKSV